MQVVADRQGLILFALHMQQQSGGIAGAMNPSGNLGMSIGQQSWVASGQQVCAFCVFVCVFVCVCLCVCVCVCVWGGGGGGGGGGVLFLIMV